MQRRARRLPGAKEQASGGPQQMPQVVLDAAALCGVEEWACSVEQRAETTSHSESCWHDWWCFQRPGEEQRAEGELFHGCCVDVAEQAVRLGVLPGPRQEGRKAGSPVAFAASWPCVGSYVGPSAVRPGHVGCVLRGRATPHRTPTTGRRRSSRWQRSCCGLGSSTSARSWARASLARAPGTTSTGEVRRRSRQLSRGQGRRGRQRPEAAMARAAAVVSGTAGDRAGRQSASSRPSWLQRRRDRQRLEAAMASAAAATPGAGRC